MASESALQIESVKTALASKETCTLETISRLTQLLNGSNLNPQPGASIKGGKAAYKAKKETTDATRRRVKTTAKTSDEPSELKPSEKLRLATEVVNSCLKSLSQDIQSNVRATRSPRKNNTQPLGVRAINLPPTPSKTVKGGSVPNSDDGVNNIAECARLALAALRKHEDQSKGKALPEFQVESAMSALVAKFMALEMIEMACKEVRILATRLAMGIKDELRTQSVNSGAAGAAREPLTHLLGVKELPTSPQKLTLVVTTQLQILRLLRRVRIVPDPFVLYSLLQLNCESSPVCLLNVAAAVEGKDKCVRNLGNLAHTILAVCDRIEGSTGLNTSSGLDPHAAILDLRCLSLDISWRSWILAGHKIEIQKELCLPFQRYIGAYLCQTTVAAESRFLVVQKAIEQLSTLFRNTKLNTEQKQECEIAILEHNQRLQALSQASGDHARTKALSTKILSQLKPGDISQAREASILCQAALASIRDATQSEGLCEAIDNAVKSYSTSLNGSSEDLDELLIAIASLRKGVITLLTTKDKKSDTLQKSDQWISTVRNCIYKALTFTIKYLGSPSEGKASSTAVLRYEKRKTMVNKIARGTIESVAALVKLTPWDSTNEWSEYTRYLDDCLLLARKLDMVSDENGTGKTYTPITVLISNVYWSRYLTSRERSNKTGDLLSTLEKSAELLVDIPIANEKTSLYPDKLERLAYSYEQDKKWKQAKDCYQRAVDSIHRIGRLGSIGKMVRWIPAMDTLLRTQESKLVGKIVEGFCRSTLQVRPEEASLLFFTNLDPDTQGLILELQLACFIRAQGSNAKQAANHIRLVSERLLKLYTEEEFPIRRLRATATLLECGEFPEATTIEAVDSIQVLSKNEQSLLSFQEHLLARRDAILAIKQMQQSNLLSKALKQWTDLLSCKQITSWQDLTQIIDDPQSWQALLETIADFSDAHYLLEQRAMALDLLGFTLRISVSFDSSTMVTKVSTLAHELIDLGMSGQSESTLAQVKPQLPETSTGAMVYFNLAQAETALAMDDSIAAKKHLVDAEMALSVVGTDITVMTNLQIIRLRAQLQYVNAGLQHRTGFVAQAIYNVKQSIRLYNQIWAVIEHKHGTFTAHEADTVVQTKKAPGRSKEDTIDSSITISTIKIPTNSSPFWSLIRPLFEALYLAASIFIHCGQAAEARYYTGEALKMAQSTGAAGLKTRALILQGSLEVHCKQILVAQQLFTDARTIIDAAKNWSSRQLALLECEYILANSLLDMQHDTARHDAVYSSLEMMKPMPLLLLRKTSNAEQLTEDLSRLAISSKQPRRARTMTGKLVAANSGTTQAVVKTSSSIRIETSMKPVERLKHTLMLSKARLLVGQGEYTKAADVLMEARSEPSQFQFQEHSLVSARLHIEQGLSALELDPILSIVSEANLINSTAGICKASTSVKIGRTAKKTAVKLKAKLQESLNCVADFQSAVQLLTPLQAAGTSTSNGHCLSDLNVKSVLTLTALDSASITFEDSTGRLASNLEYGRLLVSAAEEASIQADKLIRQKVSTSSGLHPGDVAALVPEDFKLENFQQDYIDIIPSEWHVVSVSLNDDRSELRIATFERTRIPLVLSIPLKRESRDGDDSGFTFDYCRKELQRFVDLANYSTHEGVDLSKKGAKAQWWETRAALDSKLRDLLTNIENIWLGGFKGLLKHCELDMELLTAFQNAFVKTLDKHLPSRQTKKGVKLAPVMLDLRISELFIRLGQPSEQKHIGEPILDLLYFVVDILWFNGERNAGDEIDFDPMVLEVQDALTSYYEASKLKPSSSQAGHTILILDRRLHCFPWESLPCMVGQSVSRLPSMHSLRQRILRMSNQSPVDGKPGLVVDSGDGSYILNPSGDLKNTQATFELPLSDLKAWTSTINVVPSEEELVNSLSTKSIFLYFGHGSGGQYIRSRTIKRLDHCAVSLLMGCSSGSLTEAGNFESYGTPLNYLHAGAPAVVGTLWDVTDKDIDRFSVTMLKEWGLFEAEEANQSNASPVKKSVKSKGKQRQREDGIETLVKKVSLDTAVAIGRESCIMRYLNGAAPVVYGIPVFLA